MLWQHPGLVSASRQSCWLLAGLSIPPVFPFLRKTPVRRDLLLCCRPGQAGARAAPLGDIMQPETDTFPVPSHISRTLLCCSTEHIVLHPTKLCRRTALLSLLICYKTSESDKVAWVLGRGTHRHAKSGRLPTWGRSSAERC